LERVGRAAQLQRESAPVPDHPLGLGVGQHVGLTGEEIHLLRDGQIGLDGLDPQPVALLRHLGRQLPSRHRSWEKAPGIGEEAGPAGIGVRGLVGNGDVHREVGEGRKADLFTNEPVHPGSQPDRRPGTQLRGRGDLH